jgi:predicted lipoprotein with Yx(FWY)xxD motif
MTLSIKNSAKAALVLGAVALGLAACGGDEGGNDATASAADTGGGVVSIQSVDGTNVLVDAEGRTLYTADVEKGGMIRCTEGCTSFWDPELASENQANAASADLGLDLGVVQRPDGEQQLALGGLPLYSFTEEDPGQLEGDGFVDDFDGTHFEWEAATAPGSGSSGADTPSDSSGGGLY